MNKVFSILGGISAVLLLGSFLLEGAAQDIVRLLGSMLLMAFCVYKIVRNSKNGRSS